MAAEEDSLDNDDCLVGFKLKDPTPEAAYANKRICVTGKITLYRGVPEMVLREADQLRPEPPPPAAP